MAWWDPRSWRRVARDARDGYEPERPAPVDPWRSPEVMDEIQARAPSTGDARWDQANLDGFRNELTGLGAWERDKSMGGRRGGMAFEVDFISQIAAEDRWRGSDLGARLVETLPDEMTREGWDVQVQPSDEDEEVEAAKKDAWRADCLREPRRAAAAWRQFARARPRQWRRLDGATRLAVRRACEEFAHRWDAFPPDGDLAAAPPTPPQPQGPKPLDVNDEGIAIAEAVDAELERLDALEQLWYALAYERAYGGGAILLGVNDGQKDLTKPLDPEAIQEVTHLTAFSGGWDGELVAWSYYRDVTNDKKYGKPEMYMLRNLGVPIAKVPAPGERVTAEAVVPTVGAMGYGAPLITWIHESRLLVFPGTAVSRRARVQMRGWGDSLFTRVDRVLQQYDQTWAGVANLMTDFAQGVLKIEGLAQALMANNRQGTGTVTNRGRALNLGRSVAGLLMLDSKEDFKRDMASLAGLPEVLQQFALRLAAAADMPVSLLMGQAPAGLNATGDSEIRWFYDRVAARQRRRMMPQLKQLVEILFKAKEGPTEGSEPARWSTAPRPLYQMSAIEKADRYLKIAQGDQIYVGMSAASAEEVAATRFGGSEYDDGPIVIDVDGRQEMAQQLEDDQAAAADMQRRALEGAAGQGVQVGGTEAEIKLQLTPTTMGGIVTVNQALAKMGLPPWSDPPSDGELTINEFMAKHAGVAAQTANIEKGVVGDPQSVEEQQKQKAEEARARFGHKPGEPGEAGEPPPGGEGEKQPPPGAGAGDDRPEIEKPEEGDKEEA